MTLILLGTAACSQDSGAAPSAEPTTEAPASSAPATEAPATEPAATLPAPFDAGGVKIAIVQNSGQGDYFQQYLNGTKLQATALGVELDVYDATGDNAKQASQLDQAIASGVTGIIVRHGNPDTLCPGVNDAMAKGITVVIYDVEIQKCSEAIQTQQSDTDMAKAALDKMVEDIGKDQKVGYVNVSGVAPLDRRDAVWQQYKADNNWTELFKTGKYSDSSLTDTVPMVVAALQQNPDVVAIYAPYDELTKATVQALEQQGMKDKVKVYGADISAADIEIMKADGSPWIATGATDPNAIGAAVTRTLFLAMANQFSGENNQVSFPPMQVTQDMLRDQNIANMSDLRKAFPDLNISSISGADWIPSVTFD
jgi:simple sugar transport system substrate-binding protein